MTKSFKEAKKETMLELVKHIEDCITDYNSFLEQGDSRRMTYNSVAEVRYQWETGDFTVSSWWWNQSSEKNTNA